MKTNTKIQNLVAKHARNKCGAGAHVVKEGKLAPHRRQRRNWKREISRFF